MARQDPRLFQEVANTFQVTTKGFSHVIAQVAVCVFKLRKGGGGLRG